MDVWSEIKRNVNPWAFALWLIVMAILIVEVISR